ncbi:MAG: insulinase family protein [Porphyromonas sp.]|nr:insulinase family protein [Porphyromonas sp.]
MNFRKLISRGVALVALLCSIGTVAYAQDIPRDQEVREGKLDNGLTYIIRRNAEPKERAHFYIAQRVGSILEEDSQSGLAHFLEHMAFNGTKNFPGKDLINYLEKAGVRFGYNLNAYTGFDETVYTIMDAPTTRQGIVDSCLLILHDWSGCISLEEKEIDAERGVITEEWRSGRNAFSRMIEKVLPDIFPEGNLYGKRMPIGSMEVVNGFKYQEIRDYYKKWYRPDLQGIIIVGDIDVDYVENKIKEMFKDIPAPGPDAAERVYTKVEDHQEPLVGIATDKESPMTVLFLNYKRDALSREDRGSIKGLLLNYFSYVITYAMNERLEEISHKPNAPFLGAGVEDGSFLGFAVTKDAFGFSVQVKEGGLKDAMNAVVAEKNRLIKYGITQGEYDRARTEYLKALDNAVKGKANRKNASYAEEYKNYFLKGGMLLTPETRKMIYDQLAPNIPLAGLNQYVQQNLIAPFDNLSIMILGPEKEGLEMPTKEAALAMYKEANAIAVEPLKETVSNVKLMETLPQPGKVAKVEKSVSFGADKWTLSNGAVVYVKPTKLKENQILLSGYSEGGLLPYFEKELDNAKVFGSAIGVGGLAQFSATELPKVLAGRSASVSTSVGYVSENVFGSSTKDDLETMFQLLYLNFTAKRTDKEAYQAFKERTISNLNSQKANPMSVLPDSISATIFNNDKRVAALSVENLEKANYDRIMEIYKERFANAGDFTFILVGSFTEEEVKPFVEQYIASLPATKVREKSMAEKSPRIASKGKINHFSKTVDTPLALIVDLYAADGKLSLENELKMDLLTAVLSQQYTKSIREEEGGTYGVSVSGDYDRHPVATKKLNIVFNTSPEKAEALNNKVKSELKEMAEKGIDSSYLEKSILNMEKNYQERLNENSYWLGLISRNIQYGEDVHTDYLKTLKSITPASIQAYLKELLANGRYFEVVFTGVKEEGK